MAAADEIDDSSGTVSLMTLHTAKGLEYDAVFLTGIEEDLLPHRMSANEPGGPAEERRLFYVGITRAKKRLFLSLAMTRAQFGETAVAMPSRYLQEIPAELIDWRQSPGTANGRGGTQSRALNARRPGLGQGSGSRFVDGPGWNDSIRVGVPPGAAEGRVAEPGHGARCATTATCELAAGDRIRHADFGDGRVTAVTGRGRQAGRARAVREGGREEAAHQDRADRQAVRARGQRRPQNVEVGLRAAVAVAVPLVHPVRGRPSRPHRVRDVRRVHGAVRAQRAVPGPRPQRHGRRGRAARAASPPASRSPSLGEPLALLVPALLVVVAGGTRPGLDVPAASPAAAVLRVRPPGLRRRPDAGGRRAPAARNRRGGRRVLVAAHDVRLGASRAGRPAVPAPRARSRSCGGGPPSTGARSAIHGSGSPSARTSSAC